MKRRAFNVFGESVVADSGESLAGQTFAVLRNEIQAGRWEPGERLPSIIALSRETGLGKSPIRQAYERLRASGYVCQEGRSGTILISVKPDIETTGRVIGIATRFRLAPSGHPLGGAEDMRLHAIADVARRCGWAVEVVSFADGEGLSNIDTLSGPFSERVDGIVSLFDFPHPWTPLLEPDRIPVVFFLDPPSRLEEIGESSAPAVTGDVHNGFYLATREALSLGHRDIVFFGAASRAPAFTEACWSGHCRAMAAANAKPNEEAYRRSLSLPDRDLSAAAEYLESFPDATAILCETMVGAHNLIAAAEFKGIDVPGDVSVIGHGYGAMRPGHSGPMSSIAYDIPHAVQCCLDLLSEQARTRVCSTTRVVVQPVFREGASLAVPRHLAQPQSTGACLKS